MSPPKRWVCDFFSGRSWAWILMATLTCVAEPASLAAQGPKFTPVPKEQILAGLKDKGANVRKQALKNLYALLAVSTKPLAWPVPSLIAALADADAEVTAQAAICLRFVDAAAAEAALPALIK